MNHYCTPITNYHLHVSQNNSKHNRNGWCYVNQSQYCRYSQMLCGNPKRCFILCSLKTLQNGLENMQGCRYKWKSIFCGYPLNVYCWRKWSKFSKLLAILRNIVIKLRVTHAMHGVYKNRSKYVTTKHIKSGNLESNIDLKA